MLHADYRVTKIREETKDCVDMEYLPKFKILSSLNNLIRKANEKANCGLWRARRDRYEIAKGFLFLFIHMWVDVATFYFGKKSRGKAL